MTKRGSLASIGIAGLLLAVGLGAQFVRGTSSLSDPVNVELLLPPDPPEWQSIELPLAETELGVTTVKQILSFDAHVYRRYSDSKGQSFDVYIAYWSSGKMPASMVVEHTPDICWVNSGWIKEAAVSDTRLFLDGGVTRSGEWRRFRSPRGDIIYTWFCHVRGKRYLTGPTGFRDVGARLKEIVAEAKSGSPERIFVRVSSRSSFDELVRVPFFCEVVYRIDHMVLHRDEVLE